jgi:hypothetical protein
MDPHVMHDDSVGGLLRGILMDIRDLIREELALARVEIRDQADHLRHAAVSLGIAAAALLFGVGFLLVATAMGTADLMNWPIWAGFLAVAVLLCLAGAVMLMAGRRQMKAVHTVPEETLSTLKENSQWIARRLSSVRR